MNEKAGGGGPKGATTAGLEKTLPKRASGRFTNA
jgi:hypothetical protein